MRLRSKLRLRRKSSPPRLKKYSRKLKKKQK
jgi:hypothetical protein